MFQKIYEQYKLYLVFVSLWGMGIRVKGWSWEELEVNVIGFIVRNPQRVTKNIMFEKKKM